MSFISATLGLDPLIAAARRKDVTGVLTVAISLVRRYGGKDGNKIADELEAVVALLPFVK